MEEPVVPVVEPTWPVVVLTFAGPTVTDEAVLEVEAPAEREDVADAPVPVEDDAPAVPEEEEPAGTLVPPADTEIPDEPEPGSVPIVPPTAVPPEVPVVTPEAPAAELDRVPVWPVPVGEVPVEV